METIEIQILAQDVNNAGNFLDSNNCILATAIKRQFNVTAVIEDILYSYIINVRYNHDEYNIILEKTYMGDFDVFFECANRVRNNLKKNSWPILAKCKYYVYKDGRSNMEFIINIKK